MNKKELYVAGCFVALLSSFLLNHLLTCVLIGVTLLFIPLNNGGMSVEDYYVMKYKECSLDEFEDQMFYKAFCRTVFIFVATLIYTLYAK